MKLSIIIPVYNEEMTVVTLVEKVLGVALSNDVQKEIILINDGSTDNTSELISKFNSNPEIRIFHHPVCQGKTQAVKTGFEHATGDYIIIQDADLEYDPCQYPLLLKPILNDNKQVVYGSRFMGDAKKMKPVNFIANKISVLTINLLFGAKMTDFHTCFKVFKRDLLKDIQIRSAKFSFDTELTAKLLAKGIEIFEVPIKYTARTRAEGKKITWSTAIASYVVLLRCRFGKF